MIHYSCDCCKRPLDPEDDLRYVVKLEVYAAYDAGSPQETDRDHLHELHEMLERMDDVASEEMGDDVCQQIRFDLCSECRSRFLKNPLGRRNEQLDFSKN